MVNNIVLAIDRKMHPKEFIDKGVEYENKIHSIKINSLYHFLLNNYCNVFNEYRKETSLPLFADLKLFDTPQTVANTIRCMPKAIKYITVVYDGYNDDTLLAAVNAAKERNIFVFFVWRLTSSVAPILTQELKYDFGRWCYAINYILKEYKDSIGIVTPYYLLDVVKQHDFKHTLTPGVYVGEPNEGQSATISIDELEKHDPDLIVLGRSFDKYVKTKRM